MLTAKIGKIIGKNNNDISAAIKSFLRFGKPMKNSPVHPTLV